MRLLRFRHGDRIATGVADSHDDTVRVLAGTFFEDPVPTGEELLLDEVHLLAPVLPSKLVCVGRNYEAHAAEWDMTVPDEPLLFLKPSTAVIGPNEPRAALTTTKLADQIAIVTSTPISASRRSRGPGPLGADTTTPACTAGVGRSGTGAPGGAPRGVGASIRRLPARAPAPPRRPLP